MLGNYETGLHDSITEVYTPFCPNWCKTGKQKRFSTRLAYSAGVGSVNGNSLRLNFLPSTLPKVSKLHVEICRGS
ncbi:hypothetical protein ACFX2A_029332 [Malus domestica]